MTSPLIQAAAEIDFSPHEQAYQHLRVVLPNLLPHESIEIRCLDTRVSPARPSPREFFSSLDEAADFAMKHRHRWDAFFGLGPRFCPTEMVMDKCTHEEKGADHVSRLATVWGDFDVAPGDSLDDVYSRVMALAFPPTVIVASGKGLHCYWPLQEPTHELNRVEAVNRSLRIRFGADNAVDSARILRVAGTFNYKYEEPLPVQLLRLPGV